MEELRWDTVPHPTYSPGIAAEYHLLCHLEAVLTTKKSLKLKMLKGWSSTSLTLSFPNSGRRKSLSLLIRWETVMVNTDDYTVDEIPLYAE